MNLKTKQLLTGALITGLIQGTAAFANDAAAPGSDDAQKVSAGKDGCQGKDAKDKDSCKGHAKKKKKDKNSCSGKDGCGQKKE